MGVSVVNKRVKVGIAIILLWCIVMPFVWLANVSAIAEVHYSELVVGLKPQLAMSILCLLGIVLLFVKEPWLAKHLFVCAVIPLVLLLAFGSISSDGILFNSILLAASGVLALLRGKQVAL